MARKRPLARPALVTTLSRRDFRVVDGVEIEFVPTSLHCYAVSRDSEASG